MSRKPKVPRQTIVVSNNRPKITITTNENDYVTLVVPRVTRLSFALAHAILSAFLHSIDDAQFDDLIAPAISRGERELCVVITLELRVGLRLGKEVTPAQRSARLAPLTRALVDAARRTCQPLYGALPIYDVVETTFSPGPKPRRGG